MTFIAARYYCCQPPRTPLSSLYPSGTQSWALHLLSFIVDLAPPAQVIRFISLLCRYRQGLYVWKHPHKATINEKRGTRWSSSALCKLKCLYSFHAFMVGKVCFHRPRATLHGTRHKSFHAPGTDLTSLCRYVRSGIFNDYVFVLVSRQGRRIFALIMIRLRGNILLFLE